MKFRRARGKILFIFLALLITIILSLAFSMGHLFETIFTSQHLQDLESETVACSQLLAQQPLTQLGPILSRSTCKNTVILDEHQQIRYRSGSGNLLQKGTMLPGVARVLEGKQVVLKTAVVSFPDPMFVVGSPLQRPFKGAVFRLESAVSGDQVIKQMNQVLLLSIVGAILLAAGAALIVADRMAAPLVRMEKMAEQLMRGDFAAHVTVRGNDELTRLGEALNSLAEHLHRVEATRAEFLSNVSHEIRTPLSYIQGYAQILAEGVADSPEEQTRYLTIIQEEVGRVRRLLSDLLDLAAFDESGWKLTQQSFDLQLLSVDVVGKLRPYAEQKSIQLTLAKPADPGRSGAIGTGDDQLDSQCDQIHASGRNGRHCRPVVRRSVLVVCSR